MNGFGQVAELLCTPFLVIQFHEIETHELYSRLDGWLVKQVIAYNDPYRIFIFMCLT